MVSLRDNKLFGSGLGFLTGLEPGSDFLTVKLDFSMIESWG